MSSVLNDIAPINTEASTEATVVEAPAVVAVAADAVTTDAVEEEV